MDDGKSTLIGRLLFETKLVFQDQLETLKVDSKKFGTQGDQLDFALLVDGLSAEREQGITIDVAYRFFSTPKRRFIVADTPGHEQYTRNMATGASTAQAAVILVDVRKGVLIQTKRHSRIASLLGIPHVVLAVNKMDLVDGSESAFREIETSYEKFVNPLGFKSVSAVPLSALSGSNIVENDRVKMPWYSGQTLMQWLETVPTHEKGSTKSFAMPVQWVNRPNQDFRGFSGRIASGKIKTGDAVQVLPSGVTSRIKEVITGGGSQSHALEEESVTLVLENEVDASRGDVIAEPNFQIEVAEQFNADVVWMTHQALFPGRLYKSIIHTKNASATVTDINYLLDVNRGAKLAAKKLELNEIASVNVSFDRPIPFTPYSVNWRLGSFILIDKFSNETVGAGMLRYALRRSSNIHWQALEITQKARSKIKHQKACCLWLTGLSGSGKSTVANFLEKRLHSEGRHTYILDGDNVRHGLNRDLGFTAADRVENIRRIAEVARLMVDAGLIVIVAFISPFREERRMARELFSKGEFLEVFVDTPLEECERRDKKGLYVKARRGELKNFTGIDSPYEVPEAPEIHLRTSLLSVEKCVAEILEKLET